jgi:hypothetical protein
MNRIVTNLWHCHDGWATSVTFIVDEKTDYGLSETAQRLMPKWYRSSRTREAAEKKLQRKVELANRLLPDAEVFALP